MSYLDSSDIDLDSEGVDLDSDVPIQDDAVNEECSILDGLTISTDGLGLVLEVEEEEENLHNAAASEPNDMTVRVLSPASRRGKRSLGLKPRTPASPTRPTTVKRKPSTKKNDKPANNKKTQESSSSGSYDSYDSYDSESESDDSSAPEKAKPTVGKKKPAPRKFAAKAKTPKSSSSDSDSESLKKPPAKAKAKLQPKKKPALKKAAVKKKPAPKKSVVKKKKVTESSSSESESAEPTPMKAKAKSKSKAQPKKKPAPKKPVAKKVTESSSDGYDSESESESAEPTPVKAKAKSKSKAQPKKKPAPKTSVAGKKGVTESSSSEGYDSESESDSEEPTPVKAIAKPKSKPQPKKKPASKKPVAKKTTAKKKAETKKASETSSSGSYDSYDSYDSESESDSEESDTLISMTDRKRVKKANGEQSLKPRAKVFTRAPASHVKRQVSFKLNGGVCCQEMVLVREASLPSRNLVAPDKEVSKNEDAGKTPFFTLPVAPIPSNDDTGLFMMDLDESESSSVELNVHDALAGDSMTLSINFEPEPAFNLSTTPGMPTNRIINVKPIKKEETEEELVLPDDNRLEIKHIESQDKEKPKRKPNGKRLREDNDEANRSRKFLDLVARVRGLPPDINKEALASFFTVTPIRTYFVYGPDQKRCTGQAYSIFCNKVDLTKALRKDGERMAWRYIEVFKSNMEQLQQTVPKAKKIYEDEVDTILRRRESAQRREIERNERGDRSNKRRRRSPKKERSIYDPPIKLDAKQLKQAADLVSKTSSQSSLKGPEITEAAQSGGSVPKPATRVPDFFTFFCLKLTGLNLQATENSITLFFKEGVGVTPTRLHRKRASGDAFVEFKNPAECYRAFSLNASEFMGRNISMHPIKKDVITDTLNAQRIRQDSAAAARVTAPPTSQVPRTGRVPNGGSGRPPLTNNRPPPASHPQPRRFPGLPPPARVIKSGHEARREFDPRRESRSRPPDGRRSRDPRSRPPPSQHGRGPPDRRSLHEPRSRPPAPQQSRGPQDRGGTQQSRSGPPVPREQNRAPRDRGGSQQPRSGPPVSREQSKGPPDRGGSQQPRSGPPVPHQNRGPSAQHISHVHPSRAHLVPAGLPEHRTGANTNSDPQRPPALVQQRAPENVQVVRKVQIIRNQDLARPQLQIVRTQDATKPRLQHQHVPGSSPAPMANSVEPDDNIHPSRRNLVIRRPSAVGDERMRDERMQRSPRRGGPMRGRGGGRGGFPVPSKSGRRPSREQRPHPHPYRDDIPGQVMQSNRRGRGRGSNRGSGRGRGLGRGRRDPRSNGNNRR